MAAHMTCNWGAGFDTLCRTPRPDKETKMPYTLNYRTFDLNREQAVRLNGRFAIKPDKAYEEYIVGRENYHIAYLATGEEIVRAWLDGRDTITGRPGYAPDYFKEQREQQRKEEWEAAEKRQRAADVGVEGDDFRVIMGIRWDEDTAAEMRAERGLDF